MRQTGFEIVMRSSSVEQFKAYIPQPLPPDPPLALTEEDRLLLSHADRLLGKLDGMAASLPDAWLFIYFYVRKEAVVSSQIEGTQSSLSELLLFEANETPGVPLDDVREVSNYVAALTYGLDRLTELPLSLRLLRELHSRLMQGTRGADKQPGEFRTSQNWIGGTRPGNAAFVPPPPEKMMECLDALEKFMHAEQPPLPPLVKVALLHVQFETIHPFLDGNGRLGRLLIALYLFATGALQQPLFYLSLYFKQHRSQYYDLLQSVRLQGAWEEWVRFFLRGVVQTAESGISTAQRLRELEGRDGDRLRELGRHSNSALLLHSAMLQRPISGSAELERVSSLSLPTVLSTLELLQEIGMVREVTGRQRNRVFSYHEYVAILQEGTEPITAD